MQFIVLLRGINVGGHNKIKMAELRAALSRADFSAVQTYIQSGNIILETNNTDPKKVAEKVSEVIQSNFDLNVSALACTRDEIQSVLKNNPFLSDRYEERLQYFALLFTKPNPETIEKSDWKKHPNEELVLKDRVMYHYAAFGAAKSKWNNAILENKMAVLSTTRNLRTLRKLVELSSTDSKP